MDSNLKSELENKIKDVPDFPKSGVLFRDIFPVLKEHFQEAIDMMASSIEDQKNIDLIAGIESRGFIFAAALAYKLNKGFLPIRKKGKLPPDVVSMNVEMEYGQVELEMKPSEDKKRAHVLLVDDVYATGNTLKAAWSLCISCGYSPKEALVFINLKDKNQENWLGVKSVFTYK